MQPVSIIVYHRAQCLQALVPPTNTKPTADCVSTTYIQVQHVLIWLVMNYRICCTRMRMKCVFHSSSVSCHKRCTRCIKYLLNPKFLIIYWTGGYAQQLESRKARLADYIARGARDGAAAANAGRCSSIADWHGRYYFKIEARYQRHGRNCCRYSPDGK